MIRYNGNDISDVKIQKYLFFNNLVKNGQFTSTNSWSKRTSADTFTVDNNTAIVELSGQQTVSYGGITQQLTSNPNTKYFIYCKIKGDELAVNNNVRCSIAINISGSDVTKNITTNYERYDGVFNSSVSYSSLYVGSYSSSNKLGTLYIKDVIIINLTDLYGAGHEPNTLAEFYATELGFYILNGTYIEYNPQSGLYPANINLTQVIFNGTKVFPHDEPIYIYNYFAHAEGSKTRCAVQGNISTIADKYDTSATPVRFVSTGEDETYRFSILTGNVAIPEDYNIDKVTITYYGKANKDIDDNNHLISIGVRSNDIGRYVLETSSSEHILEITDPDEIALIAPYIVNGQPITLWFLDETDTTSDDFVELNALQIELNY